MQFTPSLGDIRDLREQGNLCPIYAEIMADLETPVSAFLKIARGPHSFLLESVTGGQHIGRYSFIGSDPYLVLRMHAGMAQATQGGYKQTMSYTDPLLVLDSYLPSPDKRAYDMPDSWWMFLDTLLVFDHVRHKILVVSHVHLDTADLAAEYARAVSRIEGLIDRLQQPLAAQTYGAPRNYEPHSVPPQPPATPARSNVSREQYEASVLKAQEYVMAGDIFQVQISQRFSKPTSADSFTIYRALRTINPSPYMFYLRTGEGDLVGASPEMLVQVQDGKVETRPIAGTRWRGKDIAEDERLAQDLLADEKERAEHLMLVDLGRNDVGRIGVPGSVSVPTFMTIEKYSHVMHIVSSVTAQLRPDLKPIDALRACFPAGTVTGAPKIRAMEIIAELEGDQRGVYAGAVGHVGFNGDLDLCIALRTMVVKDGVAYAQAAAGVVADSTPEYEFTESLNKAAASLRAIEEAERM